jgi:hypothetical protein
MLLKLGHGSDDNARPVFRDTGALMMTDARSPANSQKQTRREHVGCGRGGNWESLSLSLKGARRYREHDLVQHLALLLGIPCHDFHVVIDSRKRPGNMLQCFDCLRACGFRRRVLSCLNAARIFTLGHEGVRSSSDRSHPRSERHISSNERPLWRFSGTRVKCYFG